MRQFRTLVVLITLLLSCPPSSSTLLVTAAFLGSRTMVTTTTSRPMVVTSYVPLSPSAATVFMTRRKESNNPSHHRDGDNDSDSKACFLAFTCKSLIRHDGTDRALSIPQALTLSVGNDNDEATTTEWVRTITINNDDDGQDDPETFYIPVNVPTPPPHDETNQEESVLVCIRAAKCVRLSLARLQAVSGNGNNNHQNNDHVLLRLMDPFLEDPFPIVQSVIHPKGADSVNIIGNLQGTARIYTNTQAWPLLYHPGDVVAAVRVKQKRKRTR